MAVIDRKVDNKSKGKRVVRISYNGGGNGRQVSRKFE